jgi:hypothetical protein
MQNLFNQSKYNIKNPSISRLVKEYERKYAELFKKVKNDWNQKIREFLRDETGLKFHQKNVKKTYQDNYSVDFHFVPDYDNLFVKLIDASFPELDFDEFIAYKNLDVTLKSANGFLMKVGRPSSETKTLNEYINKYFVENNLETIIDKLFKTKDRRLDIWGSYDLHSFEIEIYYLPLLLFSQLNNISLEHCIVTTLVHELAHAYHHRGKDKDNIIWETMKNTELEIKEGLAEYYTWRFVEEYKSSYPVMSIAYDKMFECLSGPYIIFKEWKEYSKETINAGLLSVRKNRITKYDDFKTTLDVMKIHLK